MKESEKIRRDAILAWKKMTKQVRRIEMNALKNHKKAMRRAEALEKEGK